MERVLVLVSIRPNGGLGGWGDSGVDAEFMHEAASGVSGVGEQDDSTQIHENENDGSDPKDKGREGPFDERRSKG